MNKKRKFQIFEQPNKTKINHLKRTFFNFCYNTNNQYHFQIIKKQNTNNYICCIHDNSKEICNIYDCSGLYNYYQTSNNINSNSKLSYIA